MFRYNQPVYLLLHGRRCRVLHHTLFVFIFTFVLTFILILFLASLSLVLVWNHQSPIQLDLESLNESHDLHSISTVSNQLDDGFKAQSFSVDITSHPKANFQSNWKLLRRNSSRFSHPYQLSQEIHDRYNAKLLDLTNFQYLINCSELCENFMSDNAFVNLVIVVHSKTHNFAKRNMVRQTWASLSGDQLSKLFQTKVKVAHVFMLGQASNLVNGTLDLETQAKINYESSQYGDIVQANFIDTYHNLTYKHLSSIRWTVEHCSTADYILKLDDDAFVDMFAVIKYLLSLKQNKITRNLLACSLFPKNTVPKRSGKWALSYRTYPFLLFPSYCSGVGYFLTKDVAFDLFEGAHHTQAPVIPIDDVFVTGLVVSTLKGLKPVPLNSGYVYNIEVLRKWLNQPDSFNNPSRYLIGDIGTEKNWPKIAIQLWNKTVKSWTNKHQNTL